VPKLPSNERWIRGDEPEGWKMNGDSVETRRFCFERYCAISLALASAPRARLFNITVRVYFVLVRSTACFSTTIRQM